MEITELCNDVLGLIGEEVKKHPRYIMRGVFNVFRYHEGDAEIYGDRMKDIYLQSIDPSGIPLRYLGRLYGWGRDFIDDIDVPDLIDSYDSDDESHWPVCGDYN